MTDDCDSLGSAPMSEGGIGKELEDECSKGGDSNRFKIIQKEQMVNEIKKPSSIGTTS